MIESNRITHNEGRELDPCYPYSQLRKVTEENKMDVTEYVKQKGTFLKAENVEQSKSKLFAILGKGDMVTSEKFGVERLHIPGEMDKQDFTFDMSKTNARAVAEKLGGDTTEWVGKLLELETYRTKTSDGKMVDAINVKGVKDVL